MRILLVLLAVASFVPVPAVAQGSCGIRTVREANWGVTCEGNLTPAPNASLVPARLLGTCTSNYDGTFSCEATVSLAGMILTQTTTGKAVVDENCTGSIKYTQTIGGKPAPDLNIRFIIFDNGREIKGLAVDSGSNLACTLKRM
jgi:hypothetical protein